MGPYAAFAPPPGPSGARERLDLLEAIATSPSPEGRLYGLEALRRADPAAFRKGGRHAALLARIAALRATPFVCAGCLCSRQPASSIEELEAALHRGGKLERPSP